VAGARSVGLDVTGAKCGTVLVAVAAAFSGWFWTPSAARAYCRLTTDPQYTFGCNTAGTPLAWTRRCVEVALDDATVQVLPVHAVRALLAGAYASWTAVSCAGKDVGLTVRLVAAPATCAVAQRNERGPNANIVAFVEDWEARGYADQALALTFVWNDSHSGEILDADTMINLGHGPFLLCDQQSCDAHSVDLGAVLAHEAGHFFGLAHSQDPAALMNATYDHTTAARRRLAPDDETGLCAIYPADASTSCQEADFTPPGGLSLACVDAGAPDSGLPAQVKRGGGCSAASAHPATGSGVWLSMIAGFGFALVLRRMRRDSAGHARRHVTPACRMAHSRWHRRIRIDRIRRRRSGAVRLRNH
jgi:hypothetical protein